MYGSSLSGAPLKKLWRGSWLRASGSLWRWLVFVARLAPGTLAFYTVKFRMSLAWFCLFHWECAPLHLTFTLQPPRLVKKKKKFLFLLGVVGFLPSSPSCSLSFVVKIFSQFAVVLMKVAQSKPIIFRRDDNIQSPPLFSDYFFFFFQFWGFERI